MVGIELKKNLHHWLQGHQAAIDLALMFGDLSQIWDDLVDQDKTVATEHVNAMMRLALIAILKTVFTSSTFTSFIR